MVSQLPANVNLSTLLALAPGTALTGVEPFETVQSGTSVAVTGQQILSFVQTSFTAAALSVLGVAGAAAASVASISGVANQVLRVNAGGTGLAFGAVNLATTAAVTGVLGLVNAGLGTTTLTSNGVVYGNGTSVPGITAAGGTNTVLAANNGAPAFSSSPTLNSITIINNGGFSSGGPIVAKAAADNNKQFWCGVDNATNRGYIQSLFQGTGALDLQLQPNGGNVIVGTSAAASYQLDVRGSSGTIGALGAVRALYSTGLVSGGSAGAGYLLSSVSNLGIFAGTGAPTLAAATSSLYFRNDGSTNTTRLYINSNGSTTWVAVTA